MILLDTHVWVWWVHGDSHLSSRALDLLQQEEESGMGISVFSCWEIAKLVEKGRLDLGMEPMEWIEMALAYPGVELQPITPAIAVESTRLPGTFHKDPGDQLIVATARLLGISLATCDRKLVEYTEVETIDLR